MRAHGAVRARRAGTLAVITATAAVGIGTVCGGALATTSASTRRHLRPRFVVRAPRLLVHRSRLARPAGATVIIHGLLHPGRRGATVQLMTRVRHRWRTLARGRTHDDGRFGIRYRVGGWGTTWVRVRFPGNRRERAASAAAGAIIALAPEVASWYDDAGDTACGFHATYGVASRTLPCGTRVTLSYQGRTLVATVDDRGPYVYDRTFDLNQNTARYLGMWGVATVFASV
ncbi:MAG TPA: septal ring lytic transglycosylase RlpA family protein [Solirubrobacteraceae bacterium]|nr:septal ring lytic transglycosylase RlpA family protein [Solirubrobacteraceae bacterium]